MGNMIATVVSGVAKEAFLFTFKQISEMRGLDATGASDRTDGL